MPRCPGTSRTTESLSATVFSRLLRRARERPGVVFPLHVGDTWLEPLPAARAESQLTSEHARLHNYAPVQGEPLLLEAIARRLERRSGVQVSPQQIQVMAGATAGLSVIASTVLDPGDEVILPAPYWPLIRGIVASRGCTPVEVPFFDRIGRGDFDPEKVLEEAVTDRTAALYLNTPHNPTGRVLPGEVIDAAVRVARRHDLWLVCDEAYEELWLGEEPTEPVWARSDVRDRAIACHTLSKGYGLAGARVGWAHGPPEVMGAIRGVQTFQTYCAPRPMQLGAARALAEGDAWVAAARRLYRESGRAAAHALGIDPPEGGTFLLFDASPHLPPGATDCMPFLEKCLEAGVLLTPGGSCGRDYARWVRLCFTSVPPEELEQALGRLAPLVQRA